MKAKYDPEANALYIRMSDEAVATTKSVRGNLSDAAIDYAADGSVVGIELLAVRSGVDLRGLPKSDELKKLIVAEGFSIRKEKQLSAS